MFQKIYLVIDWYPRGTAYKRIKKSKWWTAPIRADTEEREVLHTHVIDG
jgi:hypothetical protein